MAQSKRSLPTCVRGVLESRSVGSLPIHWLRDGDRIRIMKEAMNIHLGFEVSGCFRVRFWGF
jgi:hypothetical protein